MEILKSFLQVWSESSTSGTSSSSGTSSTSSSTSSTSGKGSAKVSTHENVVLRSNACFATVLKIFEKYLRRSSNFN